MVVSVTALTQAASPLAWQASTWTIFTYCCVIDDPPWVSSDVVLRTSARKVPLRSIAPCS